MKQPKIAIIVALVAAAALLRFVPHPPNFAPIAAMALFAGAHLRDRRFAFALPLAAMALSDLFIGLHSALLLVYVCMAISVVIGMQLQQRIRPLTVAGASVLSSILFFTITNFGVWLATGMYPATLSGLLACYTAALPFFHNTALGDALYSALLFGGYALYCKTARRRQAQALGST